ncbi:thiamine pyrophosphate-binding protein [Lentibacillus halophilus]|uniref:Thiamine pyrophosphate-binding protein n=1 Tax=Lentibacillus halophilus TaxID=295065 RepID=A0ABP3J0D7_9BACI
MKTSEKVEFTAADSVVQELVKANVEIVFGIVSIHNMPIYDAIAKNSDIHMVAARGESGAVNMADGYARATGKLGVVITSTGAGAGNAAGALTESWNKGTPLLHITGEVASDYIGKGKRYIHECKDQLAMMEGASKQALLLQEPEQTSTFIRKAIGNSKTPPVGPITVLVPTDLQTVITTNSEVINPTEDTLEEFKERTAFFSEEMIQKISAAKRPIIWAGGGVIDSGASEEVKQLAERMQSAVITSESGKGSIPENHPLCIGSFTSEPQVEKIIKESDLLISIGTRFRGEETNDWTLPFPAEHIQIDADPEAINLNYQTSYGLVGDAKSILQNLVHQLSEKEMASAKSYAKEIESVRNQVRSALREAVAPYDQFADEMRRLMPNDAILVRDVTIPAYLWGNRLIDIYQPRTSISASGGGIGQGLPTAIGAQIDDKDRTVVLMAGDGGFMVNVGELATAAEEELPLVVILFDDGGYGILRYLQNAAYGRLAAVNLNNPDYVMMSQSMGFEAEKVQSAGEFTSALETAIKRRRPSMIVVDMDAVGPMNHPYEESAEYIESFHPKKLSHDG